MILNLIRKHNLKAENTFVDSNNEHNTWRNPRDRKPYQINHFLIPKNPLCHTTTVKSVDCDHAAFCISFELSEPCPDPPPKIRIDNFILRYSQKSKFQERASEFFQVLDPTTATNATNDELLQLFEKHIAKAAKEAAEQPISFKADWFSTSEQILKELIQKRNNALKRFMKTGSTISLESLRKSR